MRWRWLRLAVMLPAACAGAAEDGAVPAKGTSEGTTMQDYYRAQSAYTSPGGHAAMYEGIPGDIGDVAQAVQNVLVHGGLLWLYKIEPTERQEGGMNIRKTEELLRRVADLKPGSLADPRAPEQRLTANCRQFAVLTCSILRHKGIPARARAGYALYTWGRGKYENHWICEYWHAGEERWVSVDTQLDAAQRKLMKIDFDPLDLPAGRFVPAGEGWLRYRQGKVPVGDFGLGGKDGWNGVGWGMVMPNVVCDAMALNKEELLPWDVPPYWEKPQAELSADDLALLDQLGAASWSQCRALFEAHATLRMSLAFD
jgi:hypothetical protein